MSGNAEGQEFYELVIVSADVQVEYPALAKTDQNVFTPLIPACT